MRHTTPRRPFTLLVVPLALLALAPARAAQEAPERISEFGRYEGFSEAYFDGWETTSVYVTMRDGVRLAVDVTRPTFYGDVVEEPLPVVWTHSRYHRRPPGGGSASFVDGVPYLQRLVKHGYVVAAAGVRGSGASFGTFDGLFGPEETDDAAELIAWFAEQPWCDGNVGMWGASYLGITQYMVSSRKPPALKAIFPDVASFDMYDLIYPGGAFRSDMLAHWAGLTTELDRQIPAAPVDADPEGALLEEAVAEHADNWDVNAGYASAPFRDDVVPGLAWDVNGPSGSLAAIRESGVPAYHSCGWFDIFAMDAMLWWANWAGEQKVLMGPWAHAGIDNPGADAERGRVMAIEQHRWFDRWLKGIENGVEDEPPIHYALMREPGDWTWVAADTWPPAEARPTLFRLAGGTSGSVESVNDGRLALEPAAGDSGRDDYRVDPATTTGSTSRWDNAVGAAPVMAYRGLAENDTRCLTYTTDVLETDVAVAGHPVARLFVSADAPDVNVLVVLEEVDERGNVRYVTEGVLRASHRALGEAPWNNLGLPYQRGFEEDVDPLEPGEVVELRFDLQPTATVFDAGHRIRVSVMGADADNLEPLEGAADVTLAIHRSAEHPSAIELPVVEAR